MRPTLHTAYDPKKFRTIAQQLIDIIADYLQDCQAKNIPIYPYQTPNAQYKFWKEKLEDESIPLADFYKAVIQHSIHVHHPNYMGHQVSAPMPTGLLSNMVSALLNNGMAVYEMGMVSTIMEKLIFEKLAAAIGYDGNAGGIFTSGGTLANLTALLTARSVQSQEDIWENGTHKQYALMVSEEAHYSVDRAVRMMGWGSNGIIKIPSNAHFQMRTDLLETYYQNAIKEGIEVIAVVGSASNTATGVYDDLEAIGKFCQQHKLWFHADCAHGGAVLFSPKYKHYLNGLVYADSIIIDFHKMMLTPALSTAIIYKNNKTSYQTFKQKADYLFDENSDWYNTGTRTVECTKLMMCLHPFVLFKEYGTPFIDEYVTAAYDAARLFAQKITERPNFELATFPQTNIVCFRYKKEGNSITSQNLLNKKLRQAILEKGNFYIVQTQLRGIQYMRTTLMNPFSGEQEFDELLSFIERIANEI